MQNPETNFDISTIVKHIN